MTPFDERGAVDLGALGRVAEHVLDCGARGVVALATIGADASPQATARTLEAFRLVER